MFRLMGFLGFLLFMIAIPAGIAWALSAGLRVMTPLSSRRRRLAIAAATAGFLPMLLPLVVVFVTASDMDSVEQMVVPAVLLVAAALIALIVGLPVALFATRDEAPPPTASTFD